MCLDSCTPQIILERPCSSQAERFLFTFPLGEVNILHVSELCSSVLAPLRCHGDAQVCTFLLCVTCLGVRLCVRSLAAAAASSVSSSAALGTLHPAAALPGGDSLTARVSNC